MPGARPRAPRRYRRREPERTALHRAVQQHLRTFVAEVEERDDRGVPAFVRRELERFVRCGVLAHGFARFRCDCGVERLVAFSCKGRGVCPSCGGRRMVERAAHLVDRVLPRVPVRQWVLSLPFDLRYRLAFDHSLSRAVVGVFARALMGWYRRRARDAGVPDGRTGTVTAIQRAGSALDLNVHFHTIVPDGVFVRDSDGRLRFRAVRPPTDDDVVALLATVTARVRRLLVRRGLLDEHGGPGDGLDDEAPPLAAEITAAVRRTGADGGRLVRLRSAATRRARRTAPRTAAADGFSLHASPAVRASNRRGLERLCRYLFRPPVAQERITESGGKLLLELKTPYADGTTHVAFEPLQLMARLAVLVPRPHANTVLYHGVFAANAAWRAEVVSLGRPAARERDADPDDPDDLSPLRRNPTWAEMMKRGLDIDATRCPGCGGTMRLIASIERPAVARQILLHLGLPADPIDFAPARAPPDPDLAPPPMDMRELRSRLRKRLAG